jgi:hypothetical protein
MEDVTRRSYSFIPTIKNVGRMIYDIKYVNVNLICKEFWLEYL